MSNNITSLELPFETLTSFDTLIESYKKVYTTNNDEVSKLRLEQIEAIASKNPELVNGFSGTKLFDSKKNEISNLLREVFPASLTNNEIKAISIIFSDLTFNKSDRYKKIISEANGDIINPKDNFLKEDTIYAAACMVIMMLYYKKPIHQKDSFLYKIPDKEGILQYFKVLYNIDFNKIEKKPETPEITEEDIEFLIDNIDNTSNVSLWKEKFPVNGYILKGLTMCSLIDVTEEQSISEIKSILISNEGKIEEITAQLQSLFRIKDLGLGFTICDYEYKLRPTAPTETDMVVSYLAENNFDLSVEDVFCDYSYQKLVKEQVPITVSDIDLEISKYHKDEIPTYIQSFKKAGIKSFILAPVKSEEGMLGFMEITSKKVNAYNKVSLGKLNKVLPWVNEVAARGKREESNHIDSIIQKEYTALHDSVHWKFRDNALNFIYNQTQGKEASFAPIKFEDVYPLFGQSDIKNSSTSRVEATKKDLTSQINKAQKVLKKLTEDKNLPIYDQYSFNLKEYKTQVVDLYQIDTERQLTKFFHNKIHPFFKHLRDQNKNYAFIDKYFSDLDSDIDMVYDARKDYDDSVNMSNKILAGIIDQRQLEAQKMFPHYFERYKTDGVEHSIYIGDSITKNEKFHPIYLKNLRLWQLQTVCEMENHFYHAVNALPTKIEIASMVLVHSSSLNIRFRNDERQFDVDGSYNARYEVIKKRIDKSKIKGTNDRLTIPKKLSIVYSSQEEEREYTEYIKFLQYKGFLDDDLEFLDLENLQSITGLKALRVGIKYTAQSTEQEKQYSYQDLLDTINQ